MRCVSIATFLFAQNIYAGITITGTRIIFPSNQSSITVQLNNPTDDPAIVQAWLDDGDPLLIPEAERIPFILMPPVSQVLPRKGQMIRLIGHGLETLPQDRESMYWFNILDIPAILESDKNQNKLNISIRSRIKLFYRPNRLVMSQDKAFNSVEFKYNESDKKINIINSSPYYLNFDHLAFINKLNKKDYLEVIVVKPYSEESISIKEGLGTNNIEFGLINDYGAVQKFHRTIEYLKK